MKRRRLLLSIAGFASTLALPAAARDVESDVTTRLAREGFRIASRRRTWLGRVLIKARKGKLWREVVFDPTTGDILRDFIDEAEEVRTISTGGSGGATGTPPGEGTASVGNTNGDFGGGSGQPAKEPPKEPAKQPAKEPSGQPSSEPSEEPSKNKKKKSNKAPKEKTSDAKEEPSVGE